MTQYAEETLDGDDDDGTMPDSKAALESAVVGHRIIKAERKAQSHPDYTWRNAGALTLTLDNGQEVVLHEDSDCCAYTEVEDFLLNPASVDHVITGVGTTDGYTKWHIYADMGDMLNLNVAWSCGNPFYYGYGFHIEVKELIHNES